MNVLKLEKKSYQVQKKLSCCFYKKKDVEKQIKNG